MNYVLFGVSHIHSFIYPLGLLFCLLSFSVTAQTSRWSFVTSDQENEIEWYLDLESMQQSEDSYRFWDKQVFKDGSYIKERMIIYCKQRKLQRLQAAVYNQNDYFVKRIEGTPIIDIVPESISERFYKVICTKRTPTSSDSKKSVRERKRSNQKKNKFKSAQVITRRANIRGGASMDSEVLETVDRGTTLQLVSTKSVSGWFEVQFTRTTTAWIHGNTIKFVDSKN